jgi:predicted N-acetyltransferase YhbS
MNPITIQRREISQQLQKQTENKLTLKCTKKKKTVGNINYTCLKSGKERNFDTSGIN